MPTSPSRKHRAKPPTAAPPKRFRPFVLGIALAVLGVVAFALPAATIAGFLPRFVGAGDFSGTVWHGSAGKINLNGHEVGAVEWRVHPASLLLLTLSANLRWVNVGFVADGTVELSRGSLTLRDLEGDGPLEDLGRLAGLHGWHGSISFKFTEIKSSISNGLATLVSATGDVSVSKLASPQFADGADMGGYALHVPDGAFKTAANAVAELSDTGGPLELNAVVHYSATDRTGTISGTMLERPEAATALRDQLRNLAQLHPRDARGRIPFELEFTL